MMALVIWVWFIVTPYEVPDYHFILPPALAFPAYRGAA